MIKLYSKNAGEFNLKSLEVCNSEKTAKNYEEFSDITHLSSQIDISTSTKSVLIFIAGYVAYKAQNGIKMKAKQRYERQ